MFLEVLVFCYDFGNSLVFKGSFRSYKVMFVFYLGVDYFCRKINEIEIKLVFCLVNILILFWEMRFFMCYWGLVFVRIW